MKRFIQFLEDAKQVSVGDSVVVKYRRMNGDEDVKGTHKVTKVSKHHFEVDRNDHAGKPMKFKHTGYSTDYNKAKSGRVKGVSRSYGHFIDI